MRNLQNIEERGLPVVRNSKPPTSVVESEFRNFDNTVAKLSLGGSEIGYVLFRIDWATEGTGGRRPSFRTGHRERVVEWTEIYTYEGAKYLWDDGILWRAGIDTIRHNISRGVWVVSDWKLGAVVPLKGETESLVELSLEMLEGVDRVEAMKKFGY